MSDHFGTLRIKGLKAAIAGNSLISAGLDIDRILHLFFITKYSRFTNYIRSGNITDIFCQKYRQIHTPRSARPCQCHISPQENVRKPVVFQDV